MSSSWNIFMQTLAEGSAECNPVFRDGALTISLATIPQLIECGTSQSYHVIYLIQPPSRCCNRRGCSVGGWFRVSRLFLNPASSRRRKWRKQIHLTIAWITSGRTPTVNRFLVPCILCIKRTLTNCATLSLSSDLCFMSEIAQEHLSLNILF